MKYDALSRSIDGIRSATRDGRANSVTWILNLHRGTPTRLTYRRRRSAAKNYDYS
jgi:hypothetical protein